MLSLRSETVSNRVIFFQLYFTVCIVNLGCYIGQNYGGIICYADDLFLKRPTWFVDVKSMRKLCRKL